MSTEYKSFPRKRKASEVLYRARKPFLSFLTIMKGNACWMRLALFFYYASVSQFLTSLLIYNSKKALNWKTKFLTEQGKKRKLDLFYYWEFNQRKTTTTIFRYCFVEEMNVDMQILIKWWCLHAMLEPIIIEAKNTMKIYINWLFFSDRTSFEDT